MATREVLAAVGAARQLPHDLAIDVGPLHPIGHPGFQLSLILDGDLVVSADPRVGLMHRSAEKLFEARDYRQLMMLANRHDWLSAFTSELCVALAIEDAMGIVPPERATWSRTLLAEVTRISASLMLIGAAVSPHALILREELVRLQEVLTGGRVHPMFTRIGGLAAALDDAWVASLARALDQVTSSLPSMASDVERALDALAGVGVLSRADAIDVAATGPVGRASGLDLDLRRDAPSLAYGELESVLAVPVDNAGDIPARYRMLLAQLPVSVSLVTACMQQLSALGDGPVNVPLPKVVRAPEGTTYAQIEGPLGTIGALLVSIGEKTPWRLKLRTASFANIQAMARALSGTRIDQLPATVTSFCVVMGDVDR